MNYLFGRERSVMDLNISYFKGTYVMALDGGMTSLHSCGNHMGLDCG